MKRPSTARTASPQAANHERALAQAIESVAHRHRRAEVFSDFVELAALSISNAVDRRQFESREKRYLEIAAKYRPEEFKQFPLMLGHLTLALEQRCATGDLGDVLGRLYMALDLGNEWTGQYFTPYVVSRLIALMLVGDGAAAQQAEVRAEGFMDLMEPACGAGGMVIAMADAAKQAGLNYQRDMHAIGIDIDVRCVHMTYVQLSLLHIPAIVLHGNSLSHEVWSRWYTPAHVMGGWRWRVEARHGGEPLREPMRTRADAAHTPAPMEPVSPGVSATPRPTLQLALFEE
jgi:hypothetical protein